MIQTSIELLRLDPAAYQPSRLHDSGRTFRESNCYVDIWLELLHALGIDPASAMAFTCTVDFEGDQWTFFKPPPEDLESLYGIDVHEMQLYRPTTEHVTEQLSGGWTMILEADSFYLPDTASTSYRQAHVKSSIAIEAIDVKGEGLRYFHGAGYHELSGEDFRGVFRLGREFSCDVLPPYVEVVRFDTGPRLEGGELREAARKLLQRHLGRRPKHNPWLKFGERLNAALSGPAGRHRSRLPRLCVCDNPPERVGFRAFWRLCRVAGGSGRGSGGHRSGRARPPGGECQSSFAPAGPSAVF